MSLSAVIITKNEEERIEACLESVKWADEIVVADTGSTDDTLKIAKKYTEKIFTCKGHDFTSWRNEALEKTTGEWVFYVDSDERVLEPLKEEVQQIVDKGECSAYAVSRRNIIFGEEKRYGPFWPDWVIRLFKKEDFVKWSGVIHEQPEFKGKLGYTKNSFLHLTHRNLNHVVLKSLDWSRTDASLRQEAGHPPMSNWRFLRILFFELWNQGVKRRGFFSGTVGTIDAILQTFSLVMSYIRLWEMQQKVSLEEKYRSIDQKLLENHFQY